MARNLELHLSRARKAWPFLVTKASQGGRPFTYREIGDLVGTHWRPVGHFLGVIQDYCRTNKLPKLQSLVTRADTRVPGDGYEGPRGVNSHAMELTKVRNHSWPKKAPF